MLVVLVCRYAIKPRWVVPAYNLPQQKNHVFFAKKIDGLLALCTEKMLKKSARGTMAQDIQTNRRLIYKSLIF